MKTVAGLFLATLVLVGCATAASAQGTWQRYTAATGLTAKFPDEPEPFDKRGVRVQGRVIQLDRTIRGKPSYDLQSVFFLQGVIADHPYAIDENLKDDIDRESFSDAGASSALVRHRALKAFEMPLPGMRGIETVSRINTLGGKGTQIQYSRTMYVGNKRLAASVRHLEGDTRWPANRFFESVGWKP